MAFREIVWRNEYSVGVEEIDEQHKKLLQITNTFLKAKSNGVQHEVLKGTLNDLIEYTQYHFKSEEEHMEKNNYHGLLDQKDMHLSLIEQIIKVLEHLKEGNNYAIEELRILLKDWLIDHIIEQDRLYGDYLEKL